MCLLCTGSMWSRGFEGFRGGEVPLFVMLLCATRPGARAQDRESKTRPQDACFELDLVKALDLP